MSALGYMTDGEKKKRKSVSFRIVSPVTWELCFHAWLCLFARVFGYMHIYFSISSLLLSLI